MKPSIILFIALSAVALIGVGPAVAAGTPDASKSQVIYWLSTDEHTFVLYVLPDGSGTGLTLTRMREPGFPICNPVMYVAIKDIDGVWVNSYPAVDIWLEAKNGGLVFCSSHPGIVDGPTSYQRQPPYDPSNPQPAVVEWSAQFSGPFYAGGHTDPDAGDQLQVMTAATGTTPLPVKSCNFQMNSADINGDLKVNLSDIPLFVTDYIGPYNFRSDLQLDNVVNLSDLPRFASALGNACP